MKSILLLIALFSLTAKAQFGSETTKKIDTIENNTATDITINPTNQVVIPYLTSGELLINYGTGLQSFANGTEDQIIAIVGGIPTYIDQPVSLPDQSGNSGKYLFTDGTDASWEVVETLPDQTGNAGKFLGTDGTNESWETVNTAVTLQDAYDEAGQPQITVDGTNLGLQIRDAAVSIADFLFEVSNNALDTFYFAVDSTWAYIQGQPIVVADDSALDGEFVVRDSTEPNGYKYTASLQGKLNPVTDWVDYTPTINGFGVVANVKFRYQRVGDTISVMGEFQSGNPTATTAQISLPSGLTQNLTFDGLMGWGARATGSQPNEFTILGNNGSNILEIGVINNASYSPFDSRVGSQLIGAGQFMNVTFSVPIENWTSGLDAAVQDIQLTAQTANSINLNVETISSGNQCNITSSQFDLTGFVSCTRNSTGNFLLDYTGLGLTHPAGITFGCEKNNCEFSDGTFPSLTAVNVIMVQNSTAADGEISITIHKHNNDVNKSQVIAGTFENIDSTDLCQVIAQGITPNGTITANTEDITYEDKIKDNCNVWQALGNTDLGTFDTFKPNKDSMVSVNMTYQANSTVGLAFDVYANAVRMQRCWVSQGANAKAGSCKFLAVAGTNYTFRSTGALTAGAAISDIDSQIAITELPDYEAIVKNLYADNITECETKYLAADSSSNTTHSDLTFNNLEVGKKYKINGTYYYGVTGNSRMRIDVYNSSTTANRLKRCWSNYNTTNTASSQVDCNSSIFQAVDTTVTFQTTLLSNAILRGNGSIDETNFQLCKLPDTTITDL